MRRMILPLMFFIGVGCQPPEPQSVTTGAPVQPVMAWFSQYMTAINAGDLEGFLALYADDAESMPPDEGPFGGIDTIRHRYEPIFTGNTMEIAGAVDEAVVAGDLAVVQAIYMTSITPIGGGEPAKRNGTWLIVLKKQSDGTWKLWRDMWSVLPSGTIVS